MARTSNKRPGSAVEVTPKKQKVSEQCSAIVAALDLAELPVSTRELLAGCVNDSFSVVKDERHPFQTQMIEMVGTTVANIEKVLQAHVAEADSKVKDADAEKTRRLEKVHIEKAVLDAMTKHASDKAALHEADQLAVKEAKTCLKQVEAAQREGDEELMEASAKKEKLQNAMRDFYTPLKDGSIDQPKAAKKAIASLNTLGKKLQLDESAMQAALATLGCAVAERTEFHATTLSQFETLVSDLTAALQNQIEAGEPAKAEREAAVRQAQEALAAAEANEERSKEAVAEAHAEVKSCEKEMKTAQKGVDGFASELKSVVTQHKDVQSDLIQLQEGALRAYTELKERSSIPMQLEE